MNSSTSSSSAHIARRYLLLYALALLALAGGLATLNIRMDPYDVFSSFGATPKPIWGGSSTRMSKAYAIRQQQPDCLLLGTSRMAIGYRSTHPAFAHCKRPYNAGLQKAHIYELQRYLQHTLAQGELREVFLGLDFEMFRATDITLSDFSEDRLSVRADGSRETWPLNEVLGLAFSLDTAKLSLMILHSPLQSPWFLPNGDWREDTLMRVLEIPQYGTWNTARSAVNILRNLLGKPGAYPLDGAARFTHFAELEQIIALCRERGIRLTLLVNPVHASYHEMLFQLGLHDAYEAWKAEAGRVIKIHFPTQQHWDFDRPNRYSLEAIPAEGDRETLMAGFWDPSHFRRELGDAVLDVAMTGVDPATQSLFSGTAASTPWAPDNGALHALIAPWLANKTTRTAIAPP